MGDKLSGKKVAFVATTGVEQVELTEPWSRKPGDLEAFCAKAVEEICEGVHDEQAEKTASA